jgi:hypothetical protein
MDSTQKAGLVFMAMIFALALVSNYGRAIAEPGMATHIAQASPRPVTQPYSNAPVGASQPQYGLVQTGVANIVSMNGGMFGQQPVMMPVFQVIQLSTPAMPPSAAGEAMKPSSLMPSPSASAPHEPMDPSLAAPAGIMMMTPSYSQQSATMCLINNIQAMTQNEAACLQAGGQVAGASN